MGGAAVQANRLYNELDKSTDAQFHFEHSQQIQQEFWPRLRLFLRTILNKIILIWEPKVPGSIWSNNNNLPFSKSYPKSDIHHLNWINNSFLSLEEVQRLEGHKVWTCHDLWPITGGCHVPASCTQYTLDCSQCPQMQRIDSQLPIRNLKKKQRLLEEIHLVAPSNWVLKKVQEASHLKFKSLQCIPNGLDFKQFPMADGSELDDKRVLLFGAVGGAHDANKGMDLLGQALEIFFQKHNKNDFILSFFGAGSDVELVSGVETIYHGHIDDIGDLAKIYGGSDLFCFPSRYETFGQVALESLACGTPCVAFNASGTNDIISHKKDGYLADAFDPKSFSDGIEFCLSTIGRLNIGQRRDLEHRFSIKNTAQSYLNLYRRINEN